MEQREYILSWKSVVPPVRSVYTIQSNCMFMYVSMCAHLCFTLFRSNTVISMIEFSDISVIIHMLIHLAMIFSQRIIAFTSALIACVYPTRCVTWCNFIKYASIIKGSTYPSIMDQLIFVAYYLSCSPALLFLDSPPIACRSRRCFRVCLTALLKPPPLTSRLRSYTSLVPVPLPPPPSPSPPHTQACQALFLFSVGDSVASHVVPVTYSVFRCFALPSNSNFHH